MKTDTNGFFLPTTIQRRKKRGPVPKRATRSARRKADRIFKVARRLAS